MQSIDVRDKKATTQEVSENTSMRATENKDNFVMHLFHSACEQQTKNAKPATPYNKQHL
jgi:hypothetical protein